MRIQLGDSIVDDRGRVGIVERRQGDTLTVRFPDEGTREHVSVHFAGRVDDWEESEMGPRAEVGRRYVSAVDGGPVA